VAACALTALQRERGTVYRIEFSNEFEGNVTKQLVFPFSDSALLQPDLTVRLWRNGGVRIRNLRWNLVCAQHRKQLNLFSQFFSFLTCSSTPNSCYFRSSVGEILERRNEKLVSNSAAFAVYLLRSADANDASREANASAGPTRKSLKRSGVIVLPDFCLLTSLPVAVAASSKQSPPKRQKPRFIRPAVPAITVSSSSAPAAEPVAALSHPALPPLTPMVQQNG